MDLNAILEAITQFLTTDFGRAIAGFLNTIYQFLYPANAEAAHDIPLPVPTLPGQ